MAPFFPSAGRRSAALLVLLAAAAVGLTVPGAHAAVIYDAGGFEPPRFAPLSNLAGQDDPALGGQGPWQKDGGSSSATVQTNFPSAGLQSVRVTRDGSATGNTRWGVVKPTTPTGALNVINVDVDMRVSLAVLGFGPLFGVEAYDASSGAPKLIGGLALDASSGDLLYREARSGDWLETGTLLSRNVYHQFTLSLNFLERTYSVFANGNLLHHEDFVEDSAVAFTDAPLVALAAAATSETGIAYFDNYAISSTSASPVPEPAVGALAVVCACGLAARPARRRP